jgi:signal transduction histidine kinase/DNA-binding NarL/FixJ family response regulator
MLLHPFVMTNNRFIYLITGTFIVGTLLLIYIQYNTSRNLHKLISGNAALVKELKVSNHLNEIERDIIWVESRIRGAIATNDTSHLSGVDAKIHEIGIHMDSLKEANHDPKIVPYINRLQELAHQKLITKNLILARFLKTGKMDETSLIANPGARIVSNELSVATHQIYISRQKMFAALSAQIQESGRKARLYGNILTAFILITGCGLCWFIIYRLKEQHRLILKLDQSEKRAREAAMVKENFMANMSHEIRTPLNSILGFTNLLKNRKLEEEPKEFVSSIQKAGENLLSIVNDILDISKIEAGMMRIVPGAFSVRGLLHSLNTLFSERVREKGLNLIIEIDSDVPDTLVGDATRLTQVLVNLVGNALKFTDSGVIRAHILNKGFQQNIIRLGFEISDTGIGIDPVKLKQIFERFQQAEDSITRNYGGTGLGLSIVKDLIELQQGTIEVSSVPGRSTTFAFYIPYLVAKEQLNPGPENNAVTTHFTNPGSVSLLVVDDNEMNQSLVKHLLKQWQFSFDVVGNGADALDSLRQKKYDLVLMDIQMPVMDGYSAASQIRNELKLNIPIIAMTAHAMPGEREKCLSRGMNEYISKPLDESALLKLITKFAGLNKSEQPPDTLVSPSSIYKYIDLTYMKSISKGNVNYEKTVTTQFISSIPVDLIDLQTAIQESDFGKLNRIAHNMKTTVSIMGLSKDVNSLLDELEFAAGPVESLSEKVNVVGNVCTHAVIEARQYLKTL